MQYCYALILLKRNSSRCLFIVLGTIQLNEIKYARKSIYHVFLMWMWMEKSIPLDSCSKAMLHYAPGINFPIYNRNTWKILINYLPETKEAVLYGQSNSESLKYAVHTAPSQKLRVAYFAYVVKLDLQNHNNKHCSTKSVVIIMITTESIKLLADLVNIAFYIIYISLIRIFYVF